MLKLIENKSKLIVILFIFFYSSLNYSQTFNDELKNHNGKVKDNYPVNDINQYKSSNKLIYAIPIPIGLTALSMFLDDEIRVKRKKYNSELMKVGHTYGNFYYTFSIAGALFLSQFIFEENKVSQTGEVLIKSLFIGALTSISLKYIFGRSRPHRDKGNTDFNWFESENKYNSLPSGDVITAFTTSTVLSNLFDNNYISVLLYGLSGLTLYQRIASDNHWFSDTVLSASIGIIVGSYFTEFDEDISDKSISYNVFPVATSNYSGIHITISF